MAQLPEDTTEALRQVAKTLMKDLGVARHRAKDPSGFLEVMKASVFLDDQEGVRFTLGLINNWAESFEAINGQAPLIEFTDVAEAVKLAADYFQG